MSQWQVGNVKITRVIEMEIAGGTKFILPQATRDKVKEINWLAPHFADRDRQPDHEHSCTGGGNTDKKDDC